MKDLCFILCDRSQTYYWSGAGFRRITHSLPLGHVPSWPSSGEARQEARRLLSTINVTAIPTRVRYL